MPVIKSAIKKLRKDIKREKRNALFRAQLNKAVSVAKKQKTEKTVKEAISILDKAVKKNLLHANKVARTKSSLSKLAKISTTKVKTAAKSAAKVATKTVKKTTSKTP